MFACSVIAWHFDPYREVSWTAATAILADRQSYINHTIAGGLAFIWCFNFKLKAPYATQFTT